MELPSASRNAAPLATIIIASVTMNGGMPTPITMVPEKAPTAPQTAMPATEPAINIITPASVPPAEIANQYAGNDGRQSNQAAHRQIDAAGDDDKGHAHRNDRDHRDLIGDVQQVVGPQKGGPRVRLRLEDRERRQRREIVSQVAEDQPVRGNGRAHDDVQRPLLLSQVRPSVPGHLWVRR